MGSSDNQETRDEGFNNTFHHHSSPSSSSRDGWKNRIFFPTLLAGVAGAGTGLISKHRKSLGLATVSASYAANFAIITGCYCGAREFVAATRKTGPEDLLSSAIAGFGSGALLGRFYGGQFGAIRYSVIFSVVGTTADYTILKLKDVWRDYSKTIYQDIENLKKNENWLRLPEWFPIKVLDEEQLAAKRAQEEKFIAQRARIRSLRDEDS
ncbi:Mitochondrial import inner membrane translocase subunit Tim17/Tim22/Tim23 family protein [Trifolium repens]|nr:Mitochondrial import inner membrane translocase subunit Tim17/Tim22/Tim23 family protein [Trifolium repens]